MNHHILENNDRARERFEQRLSTGDTNFTAAYRRAVNDCTGSLPTWAADRRHRPRKPAVAISQETTVTQPPGLVARLSQQIAEVLVQTITQAQTGK